MDKYLAILIFLLFLICTMGDAQTPQVFSSSQKEIAFNTQMLIEQAIRLLFAAVGKKCVVDPSIKESIDDRLLPPCLPPFDIALSYLLEISPQPLTYEIKNGVYLFHLKSDAQVSPVSPIAVSIAVPDYIGEGDRQIILKDRASHLDVVIQNISEKPVMLWDYASWGFFSVTLEVTAVDGKILDKPLSIGRGAVGFDAFMPMTMTLKPHDLIVREIHLYLAEQGSDGPAVIPYGDVYANFPLPKKGASEKVTMRAIYSTDFADVMEKSRDTSSKPSPVWSGRVSSALGDYTIIWEDANP